MADKELAFSLSEVFRMCQIALRRANAEYNTAVEHGVSPDLALDIAIENLKRSRRNIGMAVRQEKASIDEMAKETNHDVMVPSWACCPGNEPDAADLLEEPSTDVSQDLGDLGVNDPETGEELEHNTAATEEMEESSTAAPGETVEQNMATPEEMVECNTAAPKEMAERCLVALEETVEPNTAGPEETMEHKDAPQSD